VLFGQQQSSVELNSWRGNGHKSELINSILVGGIVLSKNLGTSGIFFFRNEKEKKSDRL